MKTSSSFLLILFCLSTLLSGCAKPAPDESAKTQDLAGYSTDFDTDAQKLFARARVLWNNQEICSAPETAMEYLDIAIEIEPEYADAYMRRALAASQVGEWDTAFSDSSKAIRLSPNPNYYALRGLIFTREGNYKGARKDLERALELDSKNFRAREYLKELNRLEFSGI